MITPELKKAGNKLVWLRAPKDEYDLPDYAGYGQYDKLHQKYPGWQIVSAYALDRHGSQQQSARWHLVTAWV